MVDDAQLRAFLLLSSKGYSPEQVYLIAKKEGFDALERLFVIRKVFDLSLVSAKEIIVQSEKLAPNLDKYQQAMTVSLEAVIASNDVDNG